MKERWLFRLTIGLGMAFYLTCGGVTKAIAGPVFQDLPNPVPRPDCRECHMDLYLEWEDSAHGTGLSCGECHLADLQDDHARFGHGAQGGPEQCMSCHTTGYDPNTDVWEEDNVHCTACHNPTPANHPDAPMPTNRTAELCGRCHIQARFEWQDSRHGELGVDCVGCHNQHQTNLIAGDHEVLDQCASCHLGRVDEFGGAKHAEQGLTCANCHLSPLEGPLGEGSAKLHHSFGVDLDTCISCHKDQLHRAAPPPQLFIEAGYKAPAGGLKLESDRSTLCDQPVNSSTPIGYLVLAGLTGLGIGLAALPVISLRKRKKVRPPTK